MPRRPEPRSAKNGGRCSEANKPQRRRVAEACASPRNKFENRARYLPEPATPRVAVPPRCHRATRGSGRPRTGAGGRRRRSSPDRATAPCWRAPPAIRDRGARTRSEEHTSELQLLMRISYAVFCLKKKNTERHVNTSA